MSGLPFKSIRDWISFLEERGELVRNKKEVDLNGEVAAINKLIAEKSCQGILHENIRGYPGWRILSGTFCSWKREAWALGTEPEDLMKAVPAKLDNYVPPTLVTTGPCKEVKLFGDEVDLTKLPIPFTSLGTEGTPNLTASVCNLVDPETGWQNVAIRRFCVKGKRRLAYVVNPGQQDILIWQKYRRLKKNMPVALVISPDPTVYISCLTKAPVGVCEYDIWGALTGEPLEVVRCETSDLVVPATSEIVIEGEIPPFDRELDGPFPEFVGYNTTIYSAARMNVSAITLREDPIFYYMDSGWSPTENQYLINWMTSISVFRELSKEFPGIIDVWGHVCDLLSIVKVAKTVAKNWPGFAFQIARLVKSQLWPVSKVIIVVDEDVDNIRDFGQVLKAIATKFQASKDILIIPRMVACTLDPSEVWAGRWGWTDFMVMDCTEKQAPWDKPFRITPSGMGLQGLQEYEENWASFGFRS